MFYRFMQFVFCSYFSALFGAEIVGKENIPQEGGVILAANHMSNWDPPLLASYLPRPVAYMAKVELFAVPIFGGAIRRLHAFPVKRGEGDMGAMKAAVDCVKGGNVLGIFPEGTRSKDGNLGKAEPGLALIAALTKAPVVPAAIIGTNKIFSSEEKFPKLRVVYGEPLLFTGNRKNREDLSSFSEEVMNHIGALKER